jgi:hypothetical protein
LKRDTPEMIRKGLREVRNRNRGKYAPEVCGNCGALEAECNAVRTTCTLATEKRIDVRRGAVRGSIDVEGLGWSLVRDLLDRVTSYVDEYDDDEPLVVDDALAEGFIGEWVDHEETRRSERIAMRRWLIRKGVYRVVTQQELDNTTVMSGGRARKARADFTLDGIMYEFDKHIGE